METVACASQYSIRLGSSNLYVRTFGIVLYRKTKIMIRYSSITRFCFFCLNDQFTTPKLAADGEEARRQMVDWLKSNVARCDGVAVGFDL